ncbi:MAG: hypothetical protein Q9188_004546 [Gyalolechia gomerana]
MRTSPSAMGNKATYEPKVSAGHYFDPETASINVIDRLYLGLPAKQLVNPFGGKSHKEMNDLIDAFMERTKIDEIYSEHIRKGAFLAQDSEAFKDLREDGLQLKQEERAALLLEDPRTGNKWNQPWILYALVGCCSLGAAVQAQLYYAYAFGIGQNVLGDDPSGRDGDAAFTNTWWHLFIARFMLGLGIGPKSATIPIYAAECTPANIRGALVMMWQMWTAFGLMLGYIAGVVFRSVLEGDSSACSNSQPESILLSVRCSLNWRLMLASPMVLPLVAVAYVYTLPESPRWLLSKARQGKTEKYETAFGSLCRLRHTRLQAARDLFLMHHLLGNEEKIKQAQYVHDIQWMGPRASTMNLFSVAYSPGEGPVPFLYSAESMPLYVRDVGMSMATALTWFFNFLLAVTFPRFQIAFGNTGAFGYYAAWCVVGWVLILLFVPETKDLTLEQLDARFSISSKTHASFALKQCMFVIRHYILQRKHVKRPVIELPPQEVVYGEGEADQPRKISFDKEDRIFTL